MAATKRTIKKTQKKKSLQASRLFSLALSLSLALTFDEKKNSLTKKKILCRLRGCSFWR